MSSHHSDEDMVSLLRGFKERAVAQRFDPPWSAKRLSANFVTSLPRGEVLSDTLKRRRERAAASSGCSFISSTSGYRIEAGSETSSSSRGAAFEIEECNEDIYERYFYGKDHWNFYTTEPDIGPVVLSLKQEVCISREHFRLIVRTPSSFLHGQIPASSLSANRYSKEDVVTALSKEFGFVGTFKQASNFRSFSEEILKMDKGFLKKDLKIGVIYMKDGQTTEDEIFGNNEGSPAFNNFLDILGDKIKLKGFTHFRGGLDTKSEQTGDESVYTEWRQHRIMYHVSTLLPNAITSKEQLIQRKRHIGNDIVCVVFVDGNEAAFDPTSIRSHFLHTFVVVKPIWDDGRRKYKVGVVSREGVPSYPPKLSNQDTFEHDDYFREFLLTKFINAERACLHSSKFAGLQERTLCQMMSNLILASEEAESQAGGSLSIEDRMLRRASWLPVGCVRPSSPFRDSRQERLEHVDRLSTDLQAAFHDKELCDVMFVVGNHTPVYGIKAVLTARSKVLKDMFLHSPASSPLSISQNRRLRRKSSSPVPGRLHSTYGIETKEKRVTVVRSKTPPTSPPTSGSDMEGQKKEKKGLKQKIKAKFQRNTSRSSGMNVTLVHVESKEDSEPEAAVLSQSSKTIEGKEVIYVCGFDVTEFSYVIEYLHTGCCHMTASSLPGLVSLAEYLELTDLQQACFDRLSDMISHDTVCKVLMNLGKYLHFESTESLFERVCEFVDDHPNEFFDNSEILRLPKNIIQRVVERDVDIQEIVKFTTCLAWGEANCHPADVKDEVSSLVANIRLFLISPVDLIKIVAPSGTVSSEQIMMALAYHADPKSIEGSTLERSALKTKMERESKVHAELSKKPEVVLRRHQRNYTFDTDSTPSIISTDSRTSSGSDVNQQNSERFGSPIEAEQDRKIGDESNMDVNLASRGVRENSIATETECITAL